VVTGGVAVSALALIAVYLILPFIHRWEEREEAIAVKADQVARLEAMVQAEPALRETLAELESAREGYVGAFLTGRTAALAASTLQTLLNGYADRSRVTLQNVDIGREAEELGEGLARIDLQLRVLGDIYGLVDLLFYIQNGEKLLVPDGLSVATARARGSTEELLTWTLSLHAYYLPGEERS
jgi:hypothetical protein